MCIMLLKKCNCFLFILLICEWGTKTFAQLGGNFIGEIQKIYIPFTLSHFGTKHGLPQNQILDIIQKKMAASYWLLSMELLNLMVLGEKNMIASIKTAKTMNQKGLNW